MKNTIAALLFIPLFIACSGEKKEDKKPVKESVDPASVKVTEISAVGKVEPEMEIVNLASNSGGYIVNVFKKDGDTVQEGELLLQLDDEIELVKTQQIKTQLQTQKVQIEIEQSNLKEVEVKINSKKKQLTTAQNLLRKGAETQQVCDDLETELNSLEVNAEKAKVAIRLAQNKLNELNEQLHVAETEAKKKQQRAPSSGTILDMQVSKGMAINQYGSFAEFAPAGKKIIRAEVDELFCQQLQAGQKVDIRYTGTEKTIASGSISSLSPYLKKKSLFSEKASDQEDRRVREIRISLPDSSNLIINSKVECIIKL